MSALGQKQTFAAQNGMSALPPKADMCGALAMARGYARQLIPQGMIVRAIATRPYASLRGTASSVRWYKEQITFNPRNRYARLKLTKLRHGRPHLLYVSCLSQAGAQDAMPPKNPPRICTACRAHSLPRYIGQRDNEKQTGRQRRNHLMDHVGSS